MCSKYDIFVLFKSLPINKILDWFKLNALADNQLDMNKKNSNMVENIVGKGENAG